MFNILPRAKHNGEKPKNLAESESRTFAALAVVFFFFLFFFVLHASKAGEGRIVSAQIAHWMVGKEIPIMLLSCHA